MTNIRISEIDKEVAGNINLMPNASSLVLAISNDNKPFSINVGFLSSNILENIKKRTGRLFELNATDINNIKKIPDANNIYNDLNDEYDNNILAQINIISTDYPTRNNIYIPLDTVINNQLDNIQTNNVYNIVNNFNTLSTYISCNIQENISSVIENIANHIDELCSNTNIESTLILYENIFNDLYGDFIDDQDFLIDDLDLNADFIGDKTDKNNRNSIIYNHLIPYLNKEDFSIYTLHNDMNALYTYITSFQNNIYNNLNNIISDENFNSYVESPNDILLNNGIFYAIISAQQLFKKYETISFELNNIAASTNTTISAKTIIDDMSDITTHILDYYENSINTITENTTVIKTIYNFLDNDVRDVLNATKVFNKNNLDTRRNKLSMFFNTLKNVMDAEADEEGVVTTTEINITEHNECIQYILNCKTFLDKKEELASKIDTLLTQLTEHKNNLSNFKNNYTLKFNNLSTNFNYVSTNSNAFIDIFSKNDAAIVVKYYNSYYQYHGTNLSNIYTDIHSEIVDKVDFLLDNVNTKFNNVCNNLLDGINNKDFKLNTKFVIENAYTSINNAIEKNDKHYYYNKTKLPTVIKENYFTDFIDRCYQYVDTPSTDKYYICNLFNDNSKIYKLNNADAESVNFAAVLAELNAYNKDYFKYFFNNTKTYLYTNILNKHLTKAYNTLYTLYNTYLKDNTTFLKELGIIEINIPDLAEDYPEQIAISIKNLSVDIKDANNTVLYQYPPIIQQTEIQTDLSDSSLSSVFSYFNNNNLIVTIEDQKLINSNTINKISLTCDIHYM